MTDSTPREPADTGSRRRLGSRGGDGARLAGRARTERVWQEGGSSAGAGRGAAAFVVSPFARFARAHSFSVAGDALVAIALADSFFFSLDVNEARWKVALYLVLTVAPFGLVAPWMGPAMDRMKGGHRYMVIGSALVRALLACFMALNLDNLAVFPLAFAMLVMGKSYHVAKSALVPTLVKDEERLVLANSRLSIISSVSAGVAGIPGVLLLTLGDASWTLAFDVVIFLGAAALATRIPATKVAAEPVGELERHELRGHGIVLAASAMGYVRAVVGFLTMLLAFELRGGVDPGPTATGVELGHRVRESLGLDRLDLSTGGAPQWHFGLVLAATGLGGLAGAIGSPKVRAHVNEEKILAGSLAGVGVCAMLAALAGGVVGASIMAASVAIAGQMGKQSFDAIVQRDAPEANLGRSFARFESQFQLLWVLGAVIPVIVPIPARLGFIGLGMTAGFAAISYYLGRDPAPSAVRPRAVGDQLRQVKMRRGRSGRRPSTSPSPDDGGLQARRAARAERRAARSSEVDLRADRADDHDPVIDPTREYVLPPGSPPTGPPPPRN